MVICLERGADLHMVHPMPLPLTVSCFIKIQIGFTFLVLAHPGSPGQRAIKRVCVRLVTTTNKTMTIITTRYNVVISVQSLMPMALVPLQQSHL